MLIDDAFVGACVLYNGEKAIIKKKCKRKIWLSFPAADRSDRCVFPKSCTMLNAAATPSHVGSIHCSHSGDVSSMSHSAFSSWYRSRPSSMGSRQRAASANLAASYQKPTSVRLSTSHQADQTDPDCTNVIKDVEADCDDVRSTSEKESAHNATRDATLGAARNAASYVSVSSSNSADDKREEDDLVKELISATPASRQQDDSMYEVVSVSYHRKTTPRSRRPYVQRSLPRAFGIQTALASEAASSSIVSGFTSWKTARSTDEVKLAPVQRQRQQSQVQLLSQQSSRSQSQSHSQLQSTGAESEVSEEAAEEQEKDDGSKREKDAVIVKQQRQDEARPCFTPIHEVHPLQCHVPPLIHQDAKPDPSIKSGSLPAHVPIRPTHEEEEEEDKAVVPAVPKQAIKSANGPAMALWDIPILRIDHINASFDHPLFRQQGTGKCKGPEREQTIAYQIFGERLFEIHGELPYSTSDLRQGTAAPATSHAGTHSNDESSNETIFKYNVAKSAHKTNGQDPNIPSLPTRFRLDDRVFELLCTKNHKRKGGGGKGFAGANPNVLAAYYVMTQGANKPAIDLQGELSKWCDFASLPLLKVSARLELFFTPANKSSRKGLPLLMFKTLTPESFSPDLARTADTINTKTKNKTNKPRKGLTHVLDVERDFEDILVEDCHEGCGFIPRRMIEMFMGSNAVGKRTRCLQVRIVLPKFGLFKGMLQEKPGISKIQLPPSCRKVGPSKRRDYHKAGLLLVNGAFPSSKTVQMAKILGYHDDPDNISIPKSFETKKISPMMQDLWKAKGVPVDVIRTYDKAQKRDPTQIQHASLVGTADPTDGGIPEGWVFIPGLYDSQNACVEVNSEAARKKGRIPIDGLDDMPKLFVSRFPCIGVEDGVLVPVLRERPVEETGMSQRDWEFLNDQPFGSIIFGNSRDGKAPLPTVIASGDLDGDLYFVCWNKSIVTSIIDIPVHLPVVAEDNAAGVGCAGCAGCADDADDGVGSGDGDGTVVDTSSKAKGCNQVESIESGAEVASQWPKDTWFSLTQLYASNILREIETDYIIKALFAGRTKVARLHDNDRTHPDAIQFGVAFKRALDLHKHGGTVPLSKRLWRFLSPALHKYLRDDGGARMSKNVEDTDDGGGGVRMRGTPTDCEKEANDDDIECSGPMVGSKGGGVDPGVSSSSGVNNSKPDHVLQRVKKEGRRRRAADAEPMDSTIPKYISIYHDCAGW